MKYTLELPFSEQYEIKLSQNHLSGRKKLFEAVRKFLEENHPAHPSDYIWDYFIEREKDKCRIIIFVIDRETFTNLRLTDRQCMFYTRTGKGREKELFTKTTFLDNGERRKEKTVPVILAVAAALVLLVFIFTCAWLSDQKEDQEVPAVRVETVQEVTNLTKVIDWCAKTITEKGGHITYVKSEAVTDQNVEIYVTGCPSYLVVSELEKMEGIKKVTAGQTVYTGGKENWLLEITRVLPHLYQKTLAASLLLQEEYDTVMFLKTQGAELIRSSSDSDSGRLGFELKADEKILSKVNQAIDEYCMSNSLFVTRFCENLNPQDLSFLIDFEVIMLEERQDIKKEESPECLSLAFEKIKADEVKTIRKENTAIEKTEKKEEDIHLRTAVKIGSVKNGNEEFHYYRTEGGKITVVKEEM